MFLEDYKNIHDKIYLQKLMQSAVIKKSEIHEDIDIHWVSNGYCCHVFDKKAQQFTKYRCHTPFNMDEDAQEIGNNIEVRIGSNGNVFLFDIVKDSIVNFQDDEGDWF